MLFSFVCSFDLGYSQDIAKCKKKSFLMIKVHYASDRPEVPKVVSVVEVVSCKL